MVNKDRMGLGWRPELAAGIFANLDQIDVLEVIADDYFEASHGRIRALQTLSRQVPVVLHGISMGLASSVPVEEKRLEKMARLVEKIRPEFWSEHLAFVRGGGIEIGHLAAPPRTATTVAGAVENIRRAGRVVGSPPHMENIATLLDPPASDLTEAEWISRILEGAGCDLLLDLHNVYANGANHGYDPADFLRQLPEERIRTIHLAGGKWIPAPGGGTRLLDDHLHEVPDLVYELLEQTAALAPHPLTVILERDGEYPPMKQMLAEIRLAREAVARGRERRAAMTEVSA
jgi:uncharacterized protein (UPF0276 family)